MKAPEFLDVDPRSLRVPPSRQAADPAKLQRQIARFGKQIDGMPPLWVYRGTDGALVLFDGITRATRVALLLPGVPVRVEVVDDLPRPVGHLPTIGDSLP